jgi:threonine aldolase
MIFGSDNMAGASTPVLEAILAAGQGGGEPSYGVDSWSERARDMLREVFDHDLAAAFVMTGTVANCLALSLLTQPWETVLCHHQAHIANDENSAPELFTGGARITPLPGGGKLTPAAIAQYERRAAAHPPHNVMPSAISLTQANECGLVYTPDEVAALGEAARRRGLRVHMDGARFANAVARLDCHPADITWRAGVDILCLGASKGGALAAEAIIVFDPALAATLDVRVKRAGQLASKGRLFGAQFVGWLGDDHWLDLAHRANASAARISRALAATPGVRVAWPTEANEVFAILPRALAERLREAGAVFYDWAQAALPEGLVVGPSEMYVRMIASFATTEAEVATFEAALARDASRVAA